MGDLKSKYQRLVDEVMDTEALVKTFCKIITGLGDFNAPTCKDHVWALLRRNDLHPTLVTAVCGEAAKVR